MWAYHNSAGMALNEMFVFETEKELKDFLKKGTMRNMELYPDEPEEWSMLDDDDDYSDVMIFEIHCMTPNEAIKEWFGD